MKEDKSISLSNLVNLIPLFGSYFILYGCLDAYTYYSAFNLNIMSFLETSEILTYFLKDIYIVLIVLIGTFLVIFGYQLYMDKIILPATKSIKKRSKELESISNDLDALSAKTDAINKDDAEKIKDLENTLKALVETAKKLPSVKSRLNLGRGILLFVSIFVILLFVFVFYQSNSKIHLIFDLIIWVVVLFIIGYFIKDIRRALIVYTMLFLLHFSYNSSNDRAIRVKLNGTPIDFSLKNGNLLRKKSQFMIGNTKNYAFIYDSITKDTKVYPINKIDWIKIKGNQLPNVKINDLDTIK